VLNEIKIYTVRLFARIFKDLISYCASFISIKKKNQSEIIDLGAAERENNFSLFICREVIKLCRNKKVYFYAFYVRFYSTLGFFAFPRFY
jgi:hypothetical protein